MLSDASVKKIRSLKTKKGREKHGLCLVEGQKSIDSAGDAMVFTFTREDRFDFDDLVTTKTPQNIAGVANIPNFSIDDVLSRNTVVVLDGVQDPGNVGTIIRLCQGFDASLMLVESADVTNPKVIRSSSGAMFHVPWVTVARDEVVDVIKKTGLPIYRLEASDGESKIPTDSKAVLIAGSEGQGIKLDIKAPSINIAHNPELESLNVATAIAIVLHARF